MKWNKLGSKWQTSRKGTSRAHVYYFITQHGTGSQEWAAGYYGYGRQIVMNSAGTFTSAAAARAYCERVDRDAIVITAA